jgi:hypothetical protein
MIAAYVPYWWFTVLIVAVGTALFIPSIFYYAETRDF